MIGLVIFLVWVVFLIWIWHTPTSSINVRSSQIRRVFQYRSIGEVIQVYNPVTRFTGYDGKTIYELQQRHTCEGDKWAFYVVVGSTSGTTAANGTFDNPLDAMNSFYQLSHHKELKLEISK